MIYIDIHRQRLSKNWANIFRFVLSPWGNYRELTVSKSEKSKITKFILIHLYVN